jgi:hypothetical protein
MKKFIFLLASASFVAPAIAGDLPEVKINGRVDSMMGFTRQKEAFRTVRPDDSTSGRYNTRGVVNDTKISFNIKKEIDDFSYGGVISLNADTSKSTSGEGSVGNKTFVYAQNNKIGRLELGNNLGAGGVIEMTGTDFSVGSYGVDGFSNFWVNDRTALRPYVEGIVHRVFLTSPNLPSNLSGNHYADAPKVTFFSQPITDLTVGVSYIPDLDSTGTVLGRANKNGGPVDQDRVGHPATLRNIFSGGIQYKFGVSDVNIKAGVAGEIGQAKKTKSGDKLLRDLKAYEATLAFTYQDYSLFGSYGDWGKTGTLKKSYDNTKQGTSYWTLGLAKSWDKLSSSLTYMSSKKAGGLEALVNSAGSRTNIIPTNQAQNGDFINLTDAGYNRYQNLVLDLEYKIADGFSAYAAYSYFNFKEFNAAKSNKGSVVLLGSRIVF